MKEIVKVDICSIEVIDAMALKLYIDDNWNRPTEWPTKEELAEGRSIFDPHPTIEQFKLDYTRLAIKLLDTLREFQL